MDPVFQAWQRYYSYEAKAVPAESEGGLSATAKTVLKTGAIDGASVLEVGCGTGRLACELAPFASRVQGIDANRDCIDLAAHRASEAGQRDTAFITSSWQDIESSARFDVVIAALCPFVRTTQDIAKMNDLTSGTCMIVTVAPGSTDNHMRNLMSMFSVKPNDGIILGETAIASLLSDAGMAPAFHPFMSHRNYSVPIDAFIEKEVLHLAALGVSEEESRKGIGHYCRSVLRDGYIEGTAITNLSLFIWKP